MHVNTQNGCINGGVRANQAEPNATALKFTLLGCEFTITQKEVAQGTFTLTNSSGVTISVTDVAMQTTSQVANGGTKQFAANTQITISATIATDKVLRAAGTQYYQQYMTGANPQNGTVELPGGDVLASITMNEDFTVTTITNLESVQFLIDGDIRDGATGNSSIFAGHFQNASWRGYTWAITEVSGTATVDQSTGVVTGTAGQTATITIAIKQGDDAVSLATYILTIGNDSRYTSVKTSDWAYPN